ncbi:MAG: triose-phosphate isomerase [Thermoplasmata archaeon]|nr:triose-phosphate isomerase [Thermoplasmata archaeon]
MVNLKTYPSAVGDGALRIGRALERSAARRGVSAAIAPAAPDLSLLARSLQIPVLAQHVDPVDDGARTGHIPPSTLRALGVAGSLVNHSENPAPLSTIRDLVSRLRVGGMTSIVCARTVAEAARIATCHPPYVAIEPPELIGGTISVSTARPGLIAESVRAVRRVAPRTVVLCGAGVQGTEDVARALALGAGGILVASAVARAASPARALAELLDGFPARWSRTR